MSGRALSSWRSRATFRTPKRRRSRGARCKNVLIYGASGGVGTFAVQLARQAGADVTGVCGSKNIDLVRSLGANRVLDYTNPIEEAGGPDDVMFDAGRHSKVLRRSRSAVARHSRPTASGFQSTRGP